MAKDDDNIKNPESTGGKISEGMDGVGTVNEDDVRARAEELAADDGLSPHDVDERYLSQAREEMTGENVPADDVLPEADAMDERDEVMGESGSHTPNLGMSDDTPASEMLINQGMEEAADDELRQGSKKLDREDQGTELGGDGD